MTTVAAVTAWPFETALDVAVTTWAGLAANDDGEPIRLVTFSDRSIQVSGTFGGASITIGGSNDGETYHALHDTAGDPITLTSAALKGIVELPVFLKPRVFGGDGTTNLKIVLVARRSI